MTQSPITLVWFRRNLRIQDNAAVQAALAYGLPVVGVCVLDGPSETVNNRQVAFLQESVVALAAQMQKRNIPLWVLQGRGVEIIPSLAAQLNAHYVVIDEAYAPTEVIQDNHIWRILSEQGQVLVRVNDRVVFAKADLMTEHGLPYIEIESYQQAWLQKSKHLTVAQVDIPIQTAIVGAKAVQVWREGVSVGLVQKGGETEAIKQWKLFMSRINQSVSLYEFPSKKGSSHLSAYFSMGLLSPRLLAHEIKSQNDGVWLKGLIQRDFYQQLMFHHPEMANCALRPEHQRIQWPNHVDYLMRWQQGETGFPLIDAAMRCLNHTGWLHPLLRFFVAEFLCKIALVDWKQGAAWFAKQLLDYEEAVNIGNWQHAAGMMSFKPKIANHPVLRAQQLDPDGSFIRRYVPELAHLSKEIIHTPWQAKGSIETNGYPLPLFSHIEEQNKSYLALMLRQQAI